MNLLAPLAVPLLLLLPGYITARALIGESAELAPGEKLFIPLAFSILISTWVGLVLAELGRFSLAGTVALVVIYSAVVWLARRRHLAAWSLAGARPDWIFLAILLLAVLLAAHPAEFILGGGDAGVYVNTGAIIARTGAIAIHDPLVQSLPSDPSRQFFWDQSNPFILFKQLRLPGFFIADAAQGLVLPQFLQFYPAWLAIFDAALGLRLGLFATPLIGVLGSVAAYWVTCALFRRSLARLVFFLLAVTVPQFWFARYPVAEAMTQFLLLTALYAFLRSRALTLSSRGAPGPGFPVLAGAAFGAIWLTRADSILLLAPLALYALVVIFTRAWRREHWAFFLTFGGLLIQSLAYLWTFALAYIYYEYTHFLRMKNLDKLLPGGRGLPSAEEFATHPEYLGILLGAALLGVLALFLLDRAVQSWRKRWGAQLAARGRGYVPGLRYSGVALLVAFFVFAYFIWPHLATLYAYVGGETPLDRSANLIKLGWYLSPFGLALALLGAAVVLARDLNRHNAFFFGTGALFALFYLEELYSNPHYIYTTRHYIPLVIPLFILLAGRGLEFLWRVGTGSLPSLQLSLSVPQGSRETPARPYLGARAWRRPARLAAGGVLALWLAYDLYAMGVVDASRANGVALRLPFVSASLRLGALRLDPLGDSIVGAQELGGAFDQIEALARRLDPNAVVIFANNRDEPSLVATPLRFLYDRDALVARFNQPNGGKIAALIDGWRAQGRQVILAYGTNGGKLAVPGYSLQPMGDFALDVPQWAFSYDFMPRAAWRVNLNYALYRIVPATPAAPYPFQLDFGGDDYPALVGGFLERATGAPTRWIGWIPDPQGPRYKLKTLSATLRFPIPTAAPGPEGAAADPAGAVSPTLFLTITARAPQDGMTLEVKSGDASFGAAPLTRELAEYHFTLQTASLKRDGDTFLLDLVTSAFAAPDGRILGAELKQAVVTDR